MHFQENESVSMVRQMVRDFAEKHIRPDMMVWDEAQTFPVEVFKGLGKLGLMGGFSPRKLRWVWIRILRICGRY